MSPNPERTNRWTGAWPDAVAFAGGLAIAWWAHWQTTDLVWSLWLSSLVVGYSLIVWTLSATAREFVFNVSRGSDAGGVVGKTGAGLVIGIGFLFGLAFFTVHFGGFHFVHSVFLSLFFPLTPDVTAAKSFPGLAMYVEVVRRYWIFLPIAFMAERAAFRGPSVASAATTTSGLPRAAPNPVASGSGNMMAPYKNVIRMHLLIFFFAAAHFLRLESFLIYAVVYAVYFFPWNLVKRPPAQVAV